MTLHDVQRLSNHWRRHPPLRVLVHACAASLGVKFPEPEKDDKKYLTAEEFQRMVNLTQQGRSIIEGNF